MECSDRVCMCECVCACVSVCVRVVCNPPEGDVLERVRFRSSLRMFLSSYTHTASCHKNTVNRCVCVLLRGRANTRSQQRACVGPYFVNVP